MTRAKRHACALLIGLVVAVAVPAAASADCTEVGPAKVGATCNATQSGSSSSGPSAAGVASRLLSLTNSERSKQHEGLLGRNQQLEQIALKHAKEMADSGQIYHNRALTQQSTMDSLGNPDQVGENVGRGSDADSIHAAFMGSAEHRSNILERGYVTSGFAAVSAKGELWVVETFMSPAHVDHQTSNWVPPTIRTFADDLTPVAFRGPVIGGAFHWSRPTTGKPADAVEDAEPLPTQVLAFHSVRKTVPRGAAGIVVVMVFSVVVGAALPRGREEGEYV